MATSTAAPSLTSAQRLASGHKIPIVGLGVCNSAACKSSVISALQAGYRHLDTAQIYGNEAETGQGIKESGVDRKRIFVCSKLWETDYGRDESVQGVQNSLEKLGTGTIDLYLLHTPRPGPEARLQSWLGLQECVAKGLVGAIGVSNFSPKHIDELVANPDVGIKPCVNQVEFHPWNQQKEIFAYCKARRIAVVAYSPLTQGKRLKDDTIVKIAEKHGRTAAQVVLRWCLQMGVVVIPKSDKEARIKENADVFGFELDEEDMKEIEKLDEGQKGNVGEWDPFAWE